MNNFVKGRKCLKSLAKKSTLRLDDQSQSKYDREKLSEDFFL